MNPTPVAETTLQTLIKELPQILGAIGILIGILITWSNNKKVTRIETKTDDAALKAEAVTTETKAAVKQVGEVHEATRQIAEQTNGHLGRLEAELKASRDLIQQSQTTINRLAELLQASAPPRGPRAADMLGNGKDTPTPVVIVQEDPVPVVITPEESK